MMLAETLSCQKGAVTSRYYETMIGGLCTATAYTILANLAGCVRDHCKMLTSHDFCSDSVPHEQVLALWGESYRSQRKHTLQFSDISRKTMTRLGEPIEREALMMSAPDTLRLPDELEILVISSLHPVVLPRLAEAFPLVVPVFAPPSFFILRGIVVSHDEAVQFVLVVLVLTQAERNRLGYTLICLTLIPHIIYPSC